MTGEDEKFEQLSMFAGSQQDSTASGAASPIARSSRAKSKNTTKKSSDNMQMQNQDEKSEIIEVKVETKVEKTIEVKNTNLSEPGGKGKMQTAEKTIDFEASLSQLEAVVKELDGEVKLEQALKLFEEGIKLSVECEKFIKGAEQKIEILKKQADGSIEPESFEHEAQKLMAGE